MAAMRRGAEILVCVCALAGVQCIEGDPVGEIPTVRYTAPVNAYAGQYIVFDASASEDPEGLLLWHQFDFGDGGAAIRTRDPVAGHMYGEPGRYTTEVGVIDQAGNKFTELRQITIVERGTVPFLLCAPSRPYCPPYYVCDPDDYFCEVDVDGDGVGQSEDPDEPGCTEDADCPASTVCAEGLCT